MGDIRALDVRFSTEPSQETELCLKILDDGTCKVSSQFLQEGVWGFPSIEKVERSGSTYQSDLSLLLGTIQDTCGTSWYHRYMGERITIGTNTGSSWCVNVRYVDGTEDSWSGCDNAPENIDELYRALVSFGMPPLKLGAKSSFGHACNPRRSDSSLDIVLGYVMLVEEHLESVETVEQLDDAGHLLLSEFQSDVLRYIKTNYPEALGPTARKGWQITVSAEKLAAQDVKKAPRAQMLALLGALVQAKAFESLALDLLQRGTLYEWEWALRNVPFLEHEEQDRERERHREQLLLAVDDNVRKRMEGGKVFTSHDVARDMGVTPQQASTRIRRFVKRGELVPMPGDYPRRYKAA